MTPARQWAAALAMLAGAALLLQLVLSLRMGLDAGRGALHGLWQFLGYFTVLSNGLVAWLALCGALAADGVENEMSSRKDRAVSAGLGAIKALRPAGVSVSR